MAMTRFGGGNIFDERQNPPLHFLEMFEKYSQFYSVNHRAVNEIVNAFHDYALLLNGKTQRKGQAFFLASARRILPPDCIQPYDIELERIF